MKVLSGLFLLFGTLVVGGGVHARETFLTVYNADLALVRQIRTVDMGSQGRLFRLTDVAANLIAGSVYLRSLNGNDDFQVLEHTFEYDLVGPERILERCMGNAIEIITESGNLIQGVLLNRYADSLVLNTDGGVRIVPWNDKMSVNVKKLPEGLVMHPTLTWELGGIKGGNRKLELTYLTTGVDWYATYTGILNEESTQMTLEAWASVRNDSGANFEDTRLKLVAGKVHRAEEPKPVARTAKSAPFMMAESAPESISEQRGFFEYYIYEFERPVTLMDKQDKQIALFPAVNVRTEKQFTYDHRRNPEKVDVQVSFKNDEEKGLGKPLPAGVFRVYQKDKDDLEFVGEHPIDHIARSEEVKIPVGNAFDLAGERKVIESRRISDRSERQTIEIELRNNKKRDDVTIVVVENLLQRSWKIEDSNYAFITKDVDSVEFAVPVSADSRSTLRYAVLYAW